MLVGGVSCLDKNIDAHVAIVAKGVSSSEHEDAGVHVHHQLLHKNAIHTEHITKQYNRELNQHHNDDQPRKGTPEPLEARSSAPINAGSCVVSDMEVSRVKRLRGSAAQTIAHIRRQCSARQAFCELLVKRLVESPRDTPLAAANQLQSAGGQRTGDPARAHRPLQGFARVEYGPTRGAAATMDS